MKQVFNPYLPNWEFVPDGEPHVFNDRLYVYGSHDCYGGKTYCMKPYVCWSASVDDLSDWTYHGTIYTGKDDPLNDTGKRKMFAPDVVYKNNKYYLYYGLDNAQTISVARADNPEGPYRFYGHVQHLDGNILGLKENDRNQFDPGVFKDDDGTIYLYSGFSPDPQTIERIKKKIPDNVNIFKATSDGNWCFKLKDDMLTLDSDMTMVIPGASNSMGTGFEGHEFYEASSMRKYNGKYYMIYSSINQHELCYAMSDYPNKNFEYKGILHSNCNLGIDDKPTYYYGNNHGSLVKIKDNYYIFGHRHTYTSQYQRQGVAERIIMNDDGTFNQAEMTSCGLNGKPLRSHEVYPTYIACVLMSRNGAGKLGKIDNTNHPNISLDTNMESHITNIKDGSIIGYKYFDMQNVHEVKVEVTSSNYGIIYVYTDLSQEPIASIKIETCNQWLWFGSTISVQDGIYPLYFKYSGTWILHCKNFSI
ncbi:MAG: family 43 glycosylhydrolase [Erysipelotrichaceae bacterium]|nr:family 43 glycosylhydrolase [Erysipelotrichaceae bacterium]